MSPLSFAGTTNDCVSPFDFPLGLITYLTEQNLPQASESLRGENIQTNQENLKQIPLLHPPGNTCESSSVLSWKRSGSLWEISFVVPLQTQCGLETTVRILWEHLLLWLSAAAGKQFLFIHALMNKLMENTGDCSVVWPGSPRSLGFLKYLTCHKPLPDLHS